ncbi:hypothetical protein ACHAPT_006894 [Fusarium lateritium]
MEGSLPSPNLGTLPTEIYRNIACCLSARELDGVTRASKRLRAVFLERLFYAVGFSYKQPDIAGSLEQFIRERPGAHMSVIWSSVRRASFVLSDPYPRLGWDKDKYLSCPDFKALPARIARCTQLMTQVRCLSFDLKPFGPEHTRAFRAALASQPGWKQVERLRITRFWTDRDLIEALVNYCSPEKLMAVDLFEISAQELLDVVGKRFERLKRLRLETHVPLWPSQPFPFIEDMRLIAGAFPHLECLVLDENAFQFRPTVHPHTLNVSIDEVAAILQTMPSLRRFAFRLNTDRFRGGGMRQSLSLDKYVSMLGYTEVSDWFETLIHGISDKVPKLREICIFYNDCAYHGTRDCDEEIMTILPNKSGFDETYLGFPWGLRD